MMQQQIEVGTRVKLVDNPRARIFGYANKTGQVIGGDPKNKSETIVRVQLDHNTNVVSTLETDGIEIRYLIVLSQDKEERNV